MMNMMQRVTSIRRDNCDGFEFLSVRPDPDVPQSGKRGWLAVAFSVLAGVRDRLDRDDPRQVAVALGDPVGRGRR
jgi:hypothetical protein